MSKNKKACIGIIGLGAWGKNILRNLYEMDLVSCACDADKTILNQREKDFPGIKYTNSVKSILNDPAIKGAVISTPAATHYKLVKQALKAGKNVFVEKPLALDVAEGEELVALSKKLGKILMVGHILQYHPAILKLKELIDDGKLGKIQYIYSNRLNIGKLRTEENILWSFAPHDISVILMLVGEEPVSVRSFGEGYLNKEIFDVTLTDLEFKKRIKAHIFVSWLHPFKEQKLVVVGSKAMAVFDDLTKEKLFIYPHKIEWKKGKIPVAHKADYKTVKVKNCEPLKEEIKHFMECITKGKRPVTDGEEGLRVLRVLDAAGKNTGGGCCEGKSKDETYFVHSTCSIDENVKIGNDTKIWNYSHVLKDSVVGKKCIIGQNVAIGPDVKIGNGCKIQNNVSVYKGVTLEDDVFCAPSCVFTNVYTPRAFIERKDEFRKTLVRKGATVGANATVICGVTIGRYALIGAGAVVREDVPDYALVVGVPARQKGWVCSCGEPLKDFKGRDTKCKRCKKSYKLKKDHLVERKS